MLYSIFSPQIWYSVGFEKIFLDTIFVIAYAILFLQTQYTVKVFIRQSI